MSKTSPRSWNVRPFPRHSSATALMFHNKVRMKQLFASAGLTPVPHREVQCVDDVVSAFADLGPVVLKPRLGTAAVGVHILDRRAALRHVLTDGNVLAALEQGALMVEPFVDGDVFHVDIAIGGEEVELVSPS